ncbi:LysR family transcriptional regulator [Streptomyces sp. NPDC048172]|uniref:LysR family transcriptional regulator n=1 Tax=Streptomyces sp. NPDC048172 TaxID=3365505 RepID=UPI0037136413
MEREEVECLLILAEELHFGRTAERMRLSRARVSQLVQRLERRVGAPLFVRTSRRVVLTALGAALREELEPHHRAIDAALARAAASARAVEGTLNVGFSGPLAGEAVMRTADALGARHPGVEVHVCEVPFADPYSALRAGTYDVQLVELPIGRNESDLVSGPGLFTEGRVLAVGRSHPLAARSVASLEDLADVPLLTVDADLPAACRTVLAPDRTPSGRPVPPGPAVSNAQEALVFVAAGKGAWLTAAHAATYHPWPGVTYVPLADADPLTYGLVWRETHHTPTVRAFAHAAREVL